MSLDQNVVTMNLMSMLDDHICSEVKTAEIVSEHVSGTLRKRKYKKGVL